MRTSTRLFLSLFVVAGLQTLINGGAAACEKQNGAPIFSDAFADAYGGWDLTANAAEIKPPVLALELGKTYTGIASQVLTFSTLDGDYCMDFVLPTPPPPSTTIAAGLQFWATDYANTYVAMVYSDTSVGLYRKNQNNWTTIFSGRSTAVLTGADAVNSIRIVTKGTLINFSVNGQHLFTIRAQVPTGNARFGVYGQIDVVAQSDTAIKVKAFSVTAGQ